MSHCPDPATLDAFVRGDLAWGTRLGIEGHIDACPDCAAVVSELARLFGSAPMDEASAGTEAVSVPVTVEAPPQGLMVGRYRLGRQLGSGAMGMVFEAHDPQLHRRVAIKLLHPDVAEGPEGARLLREARAMAQLAHPNVVTVHDAGRAGSQVFVAMELVEGNTLGGWLAQAKRDRASVLSAFVQAGRGLEAAHRVGIVHRDFKPDNVMLGADGRARVADFGLARPSVSWSTGQPEPSGGYRAMMTIDGLTHQGAVVGTPAYMAPEQWNGAMADARSDQFSFCVALYEAIAGHRPFEGDTLPALAASVTQGRLRSVPRGMPRWLRDALLRGLEVDPSRRYPSMTALLRVLERDRGLGRRSAAVIGAMAIGAGASVGVLRWMAEEASEPPPPTWTPEVAAIAPPDREDAPAGGSGSEDACLLRARTADGAWNEPRRDAYAQALRRSDPQLEVRALPVMDRWIEGYAELARSACEGPTPELATVRARCLDSMRVAFDALVAETTQQNRQTVARGAATATYRLPDVHACGREPFLLALSPPPPATIAGRVELLRADLAGGRALTSLGAFVRAPSLIAPALEQARALGHGPLLADALLAHGQLAAARGDVAAAVAALEEAVTVAEGSDATWVMGRAATALLVQHGARRPNGAAVARWRRVTGAFVERLGEPAVTAEVMRAEAEVLLALLHVEDAYALLRSALEINKQLYGERHPRVGGVHRLLAEAALERKAPDGARAHAERARSIFEETVGPTARETLASLRLEARVAQAQGRLDDAETIAKRAVDGLALYSTGPHDVDHGDALLILGDVQRAAGKGEAARASYEKAKVYHYQGHWPAHPLLRLSALERSEGDAKAALALAREAVEIIDAALAPDDIRRIDALRELARAQRARGASSAARETLEAVRRLVDDQVGYGPLQSRSMIEQAELAREQGEAETALSLLDDAHVAWAGAYGQHHPEVVAEILVRADLAWEVGKRDYARRLYGAVVEDLGALRGVEDPGTVRARRRAE